MILRKKRDNEADYNILHREYINEAITTARISMIKWVATIPENEIALV